MTATTTTKQTILITGATAGIGRHAAFHLARRGFRVVATGRKADALESLRSEALADSLDLHAHRLDVTDPASIDAAVAFVDTLADGRGLDVLINNAGYGTAGPLSETSDDELRAQYDTNVFGLMAVTRAFLPKMRDRRAGRIINVSSIGGKITFPFFGAYNSTKYALESLSDALRLELRPFGIRVVVIEPGVIKSEFADRTMDELAKHRTADSPYAGMLDRADEVKRLSDRGAVGPEVISRAMERAITARRPRARYIAPLRGRLTVLMMNALPTRLVDAILARFVGLTPRHLEEAQRAQKAKAEATDGARPVASEASEEAAPALAA